MICPFCRIKFATIKITLDSYNDKMMSEFDLIHSFTLLSLSLCLFFFFFRHALFSIRVVFPHRLNTQNQWSRQSINASGVSEEKDEEKYWTSCYQIMWHCNWLFLEKNLENKNGNERESMKIPSTYCMLMPTTTKSVLIMSFDWYKTWHDGIENQSILCICAVCSMEICFLFAQFIFVSIKMKTEKKNGVCLHQPKHHTHACTNVLPKRESCRDFHVEDLFACHKSTEMSKRKASKIRVKKTKKRSEEFIIFTPFLTHFT